MSAHSPGPWHYGTDFGEEWFTDARGETVFMSDPANHRIVEVAPEMLELLREAVRLECRCPGVLPGFQERKCRDCRMSALLARIDGAAKER